MRKIQKYSLFIVLFCLFYQNGGAQQNCRIVSYNVENFFDFKDDSLKNDAEFLADGDKNWNYTRYRTKQSHISQVIATLSEWGQPPAVVGLCEVENDQVLKDLTRKSELKQMKYSYIHQESPDSRGIDVALLFQPDQFKLIQKEFIRIRFPNAPHSKTRDVLMASGRLLSGDTLQIFMCHLPSRIGGEEETEAKRMFVTSLIRHKIDSILISRPKAKIIVMGDMNDMPDNASMTAGLGAQEFNGKADNHKLYNMMFPIQKSGKGTNKYKGEWGALDQIIVSGSILKSNAGFINKQGAKVYEADFLLTDDVKYFGKMPFRTYEGRKYIDGYSDHLPVYIDLQTAPKN